MVHHSYDYVRAIQDDRRRDTERRRLLGEVATVELGTLEVRRLRRERTVRRIVGTAAAITVVVGLSVPMTNVAPATTSSTTTIG